MLSILHAAGWPIWTIVVASIISLAIIIERLFALRRARIAPTLLLNDTVARYRREGASSSLIAQLAQGSPLAQVFSAGIKNVTHSRDIMKEAIEEAGRAVTVELDRYLTTLGTIAAMAPLLGLLGTVIGMIDIFGAQGPQGSDPQQLAHGISIALYNTAFGLIVAIPSMIFYRYFRAKADALLITMEQEAIKLVELIHGERDA